MNENNNTAGKYIPVLLVGLVMDDNPDFETSMEELESLAEACEMEVKMAKIEQNLSSLNPAYYIGSSKVKKFRNRGTDDLDYVILINLSLPS